MSHLTEVRSHRRLALAGAFVVILLSAAAATDQWSTSTVSAVLGFVTAVMIIATVFVGWERQVDAAESDGLVKHYDQHTD